MKPTLLILAAGMGSRYGGLKQVDGVGPNGEPIIEYSVYDAIRAGFGKVVFVIRKDIEEAFRETFGNKFEDKIEVKYAFQAVNTPIEGISELPEREKPWGTGHAVLVAHDLIHEPFAVINADDYYGPGSYQLTHDYLLNPNTDPANDYCMVGYMLDKTLSEHGYVSRGICETDSDEFLQTVVERTHIERVDGKIITQIEEGKTMELTGNEVVSMNFWGFMPSYFDHLETYFTHFIRENAQNPKGEFYIPTVVNDLIDKGKINLKVLQSKDLWFGVTYKEDKASAVNSINKLIAKGVYPEKLWK